MQNDSATDFIQTDLNMIFPKTNEWYEELMDWYQQIGTSKKLLDQSKNDEEYMTRWDSWNQNYHWWLIRMDQFLCYYNTKEHDLIHEIVYNAFHIGKQTGYWNNKYSRLLYEWFQKHFGEVI